MSNLQIFPYVLTDTGQWSISDMVMASIFDQMAGEGKIEHLFYDGTIRDMQGWLDFIKRPGNHVIIVADMDKQKPVHIAWLNNVADGVAWAHHCSVGKYQRGAWEAVRDFWQQFDFLHILLGLTPETNKRAVKFLEKICGFTILGTIPELCSMAYEDRRVGGVVSYYQLRHYEEAIPWAEENLVAARAVHQT